MTRSNLKNMLESECLLTTWRRKHSLEIEMRNQQMEKWYSSQQRGTKIVKYDCGFWYIAIGRVMWFRHFPFFIFSFRSFTFTAKLSSVPKLWEYTIKKLPEAINPNPEESYWKVSCATKHFCIDLWFQGCNKTFLLDKERWWSGTDAAQSKGGILGEVHGHKWIWPWNWRWMKSSEVLSESQRARTKIWQVPHHAALLNRHVIC